MAAFARSVTLVRRAKATPDAFGNDTWTETTSQATAIYVPGGGSEQTQGRDSLIDQPAVYLPAGTDVRHIDAVVIGSDRFEVDGEPQIWTSPLTGWAPGVEVRLRRATG